MAGELRQTARVRETRDRVITGLQDHFAHDNLDVDELERRVTLAHTAASVADIEALTSDLEPLPSAGAGQAAAPSVTTAIIPAGDVQPTQTIRALMSATTRTGPWAAPRRLRLRSTMSATVLDFREARFPPGLVDLEIRALMSSVEIIVPPGLAVETEGSAIMGVFDHVDRAPADPDPDAPLLRIHGAAFMSAVEVKMRLPGETDCQHHHRKRQELRDGHAAPRALDRPR